LVTVSAPLTSLNLSENQLCGLNAFGKGTYTAEGITAIADALRVNGALTQVLALSDPPKTAFSVTLTFAFLSNRISAEHIKQPAVRPR
jgi:hypothetical protein